MRNSVVIITFCSFVSRILMELLSHACICFPRDRRKEIISYGAEFNISFSKLDTLIPPWPFSVRIGFTPQKSSPLVFFLSYQKSFCIEMNTYCKAGSIKLIKKK